VAHSAEVFSSNHVQAEVEASFDAPIPPVSSKHPRSACICSGVRLAANASKSRFPRQTFHSMAQPLTVTRLRSQKSGWRVRGSVNRSKKKSQSKDILSSGGTAETHLPQPSLRDNGVPDQFLKC